MDTQDRELLEKILSLAEEDHKILQGMRRAARFSRLLGIAKLLVIAGLLFAAYVYIQPYLQKISAVTAQVNSFTTSPGDSLQGFWNSLTTPKP